MKFGERYLDKPPYRFRCRAIIGGGKQCSRASTSFVCGVAICTAHRRGMKAGKPFSYVVVP